MSVNKVILLGNLGSDVNIRHLPDGRPVGNVNIATTEVWRDRDGNKQKQTEWHRLILFGRQAEVAGDYLRKGSQIFVEGQLRTRNWTDRDNNERQTTEIRVLSFKMLGSRGDRERSQGDDDYGNRSGGGGDGGYGGDNRTQRDREPVRQDGDTDKTTTGGPTGGPFEDTDEDIPW